MKVSEEELTEIEKQEKMLRDVQQMIGIKENASSDYQVGFNYAIYRTAFIIDNKNKEIERLHSIIKEVREYIEELLREEFEITDTDSVDYGTKCQRAYFSDSELIKVLEILEKENI